MNKIYAVLLLLLIGLSARSVPRYIAPRPQNISICAAPDTLRVDIINGLTIDTTWQQVLFVLPPELSSDTPAVYLNNILQDTLIHAYIAGDYLYFRADSTIVLNGSDTLLFLIPVRQFVDLALLRACKIWV